MVFDFVVDWHENLSGEMHRARGRQRMCSFCANSLWGGNFDFGQVETSWVAARLVGLSMMRVVTKY